MTEEKVLQMWDKLNRAYDAFRKTQAKYTYKHKLTAPQFSVLEVLNQQGPMPLKRISEHLLVTGANITCVVDNLEKEDLVKRVPSKQDRRVIHAEITEKGKAKMSDIYTNYVNNMRETAAVLSEGEVDQLINTLDKISENAS
ncbi:MAG: MarR family transcriptional regulator [Melioribacteraceae bacterium]|jgi:MarR family 2-MHQ and catechol resistance regulon transcriptional repressor|nr:MarR family transcriptional regulator [Ignavibacteriota bacterium]MBZ0181189.1 MarR family transcriptional regulator [Melioribacteraceae bacterium]